MTQQFSNGRALSPASGFRTAIVSAIPIAVIGWLAFDDGGYELITRQQGALAIWWLLALGFVFGVLPHARAPRAALLAAIGALALTGLQLASVAWGPSDDRAIAEACRTLGYLGVLALAWTGLGPRTWASAAGAILGIASFVAGVALLGRLAPALTGLEDPFGAGRLAEPLGYWNALAAWAAVTVAMALAWSGDARHRRTRMAAAAVLPVAATTLYLTYSRGGVLAAALGVGLVVGLSRNRRRTAVHAMTGATAAALCVLVVRSQPAIANGTGTEGAWLVGLCVALAAGGCALAASATRSLARRSGADAPRASAVALGVSGALVIGLIAVALVAGRDGFGRGADAAAFAPGDPASRLLSAAGNRSAYWSEALDSFGEHPVRGEGAGAFGYRWAAEGSEREQVADPHSLPLAVASELGALGLLALAVLVAGLALGAARGLRAAERSAPAVALAAASGVFALSAAIDWTWDSTALAVLGLASAGTLTMAAAKPAARARLAGKTRWALAAAAVAFGAIQIPGVVAADSLRRAAEQHARGQFAAAAASAGRALDAAPWSAAAHSVRAEARLELRDLQAARDDALAAIDGEPREAEHWILLARIEAARDDLRGAAAALREAVRLSPHEARLGGRAVQSIGARLGRAGFDEADITGDPVPR